MTVVLLTVDTELSPGFHQRGMSAADNLRRNVFGEVTDGTWGIGYQMSRLNAHGLKAVFFVEALCAYVYGDDILKRIVDPILDAGHEVQLHLHPEWLKWTDHPAVHVHHAGGSIADYGAADQRLLLERGIEALVRAGVPKPTAFRAGNYGANNDTLRALASLGLAYDTSYNHAALGTDCRIVCDESVTVPRTIDGVVEIPITFFADYPGHSRSLQLCAVSNAEMDWVLRESAQNGQPTVVAVSHSFELLNVPRTRSNQIILKRFDQLCAKLAAMRNPTATVGFNDLTVDSLLGHATSGALKSNALRTAMRMFEQGAGRLIYDRA